MKAFSLALAATLLGAAPISQAQQAPPDTLRLGVLQRQARAADPRLRESELLTQQSRLRLDNLSSEWLPSLTGQGQAQYQSDVTKVPVQSPAFSIPTPPHDTYDAHVRMDQSLFDPTRGPRRGLEHAELKESEARLETALYGLRQEVNEAFFAMALLDARSRLVQATITDLEARLREVAARLREGSALPGDTASIAATVLLRRQDALDLSAQRRAALNRLEILAGHSMPDSVLPQVPELDVSHLSAGDSIRLLRSRPEYQQFAVSRDRLVQQERVIAARSAPRISAFGRAGYGQPGLNQLNDGFDSYWLAGVQAQWSPFTWGRNARERQVLALQREITRAEEAAFTSQLTRTIQEDLAGLARLDSTIAMDRRLIGLRELVERESRLRFQESVMTAADYLDRSTDVLESRLALAAHEIERARLKARLLTTLGQEIP